MIQAMPSLARLEELAKQNHDRDSKKELDIIYPILKKEFALNESKSNKALLSKGEIESIAKSIVDLVEAKSTPGTSPETINELAAKCKTQVDDVVYKIEREHQSREENNRALGRIALMVALMPLFIIADAVSSLVNKIRNIGVMIAIPPMLLASYTADKVKSYFAPRSAFEAKGLTTFANSVSSITKKAEPVDYSNTPSILRKN